MNWSGVSIVVGFVAIGIATPMVGLAALLVGFALFARARRRNRRSRSAPPL
jgi:hypothetical protein